MSLRGIAVQTVEHIFQMAIVQQQEALPNLGGEDDLPADADGLAGAAQYVGHPFHHALHVLVPKLLATGVILDVFFRLFLRFISIYPSARWWSKGGMDRQIKYR